MGEIGRGQCHKVGWGRLQTMLDVRAAGAAVVPMTAGTAAGGAAGVGGIGQLSKLKWLVSFLNCQW